MEEVLTPIPAWLAECIKAPAVPIVNGYEAALTASLRIKKKKDENDGSKRGFAIACRAVEHDLTLEQTVELFREVQKEKPFPRLFSEEKIHQLVGDAEKRCERGSALIVKPRINVTAIDLDVISRRVWPIVKQKNEPPVLFRFAGQPSRIQRDDNDQPLIHPATDDVVRYQLARWFHFYKVKTDGSEYPVAPPLDVIRDLMAEADLPLPKLRRVVNTPVFGRDGQLMTTPGYHPSSQTYFVPPEGFELREVTKEPTAIEVEIARKWIVDELFFDFPFVGDSERTLAVALLLLPFARDFIAGPTPFHLVHKPSPGTGGTLLINCCHQVQTGRDIAIMTEATCEEEWRKRLTAKFRTAPSHVFLDNIKLPLDSGGLAAAITAEEWEDRILGTSQFARIPVNCVFCGTGNNPTLSDEIARRTVSIRLDAKQADPWLRSTFKHKDLRCWIHENRAELVHSCLTLIQAWIAAAKPEGGKTLGMFESWSRVMGGILSVANIPGFLGNLTQFYSQADAARAIWQAFMKAWLDGHGNNPVRVADLFQLAVDAELPIGTSSEHSQKSKLGKLLTENHERIYELDQGGVTATVRVDKAGSRQGAMLWRLSPIAHTAIAA